MPTESTNDLALALSRLNADPRSKQFRPILDIIEPFVHAKGEDQNAQDQARKNARLLIDIVSAGYAATEKGIDAGRFIEETSRGHGYYQDHWQIDGNVIQPGRDATITNIQILLQGAAHEFKPPDTLGIPIVLVAMTLPEAEAMAAETVFKGQPRSLLTQFKSLASHLRKIGHGNWTNNYGATSGEWRPAHQTSSIMTLANRAIQDLNDAVLLPKQLRAEYYDVQRLIRADMASKMLLSTLRMKGCVVIIDAISMRNPLILRAYQRTLLDVFPATSVLSLAPQNSAFPLLREMLYGLEVSLKDSEWNRRRLDTTEDYACHELSDMEEFPKWLLNRVKRISQSTGTGGSMIENIRASF